MTDPVVKVPTEWETIEAKAEAFALTAKTILSNAPSAALAAIEADVEAGVSKAFPALTPLLDSITPFLPSVVATVEQLVTQLSAIQSVPVKPAA